MQKKIIILLIVAIALITGGLFAFKENRLYQQQQVKLYGNVDIRNVNLSFRVGGRLATLAVDEGANVEAGQVLGQLEQAPYQIALQQAKANVEAQRANLSLLEAGYRDEEIAQTRAAVSQAQASYDYAQSFYRRQLALWKSKMISANTLENALSARNQAKATLQSARDKLRQFIAGNRPQQIEQARASLAQAVAAEAKTELDLQDTTLLAPSAGIILTRAVEPGTLLAAGNTVFSESLLNPVWIHAYIDEVNLGQAQPGRKVRIHTDSRPDKSYDGHIGFISPSAEFTPKSVETPTLRTDLVYRLRIIVTNPDPELRQGMPVTIELLSD